ncbi:putative Transcriptional regulator PurR family [Vibrio nigripulchritudo MADA3029]|uniref:LacI family DNA-binding transcriptional regulator n=1 Tax=Vibrio nigripulchritudo TaxID=28173 RepID=UPI0003B1DB23|nr:LacI family DNA-binding transcriptional regulator [Vibrio nigripulchritudo]CCN50357.1 putative Transcriptional regulator PurR family [Vibrio nigripulchritudo MADA3020]CCN52308.1 putative Transcriptional regulator PurR family [Vibrio nigripulchritudo MADA3021]CCN62134.1 putative Transcriptional regulator PurR family [Vibrio nigripulchritudo MADA3029]
MSKFTVKQIAAQAGFSTATVDRALHGRNGVHDQTRQRVEQAISELREQYKLDALQGRTFYIDVIMYTPARFSHLVRESLNRISVQMAPFRIRLRYFLYQDIDIESLSEVIHEAEDRGSHGVLLKAPDHPEINQAVNRLHHNGIPTVTLVTDLPGSKRLNYIGIDNISAGETAAFLMTQWLGSDPNGILLVQSSHLFHGEEARAEGFSQFLSHHPHIEVTTVSEGHGLNLSTKKQVKDVLGKKENISAVYSIGGGNRAILDAFQEMNRPIQAFIGHDLDDDNRHLLRSRQLHAVIDHNLDDDARVAFSNLLSPYGLMPTFSYTTSRINIVTPFNLP